jgi:hypothetical protein
LKPSATVSVSAAALQPNPLASRNQGNPCLHA